MTKHSTNPLGIDEHEDQDDAIIGRVFRWSLAVIGLLVLVVMAVVWAANRSVDKSEETIDKDTTDIQSLDAVAAVPQLTFTDITQAAGIDFVHANGATGDKLLPETMGGGVAFLDFDGDGDEDLFFVNSSHWPTSDVELPEATSRLFANRGDGTFETVADSGLEVTMYGMGCAVGDYDNDGDADVFISALGKNRLFRNDDSKFMDVTDVAHVAGGDAWSTSCGFFDYDRDGDLDLFVCNYVQWTREIDFKLNFTLNGEDRAYGPPSNFKGCYPCLYRNNGDGTFTDVSEQAGLHVENPDSATPVAKSLAVVFEDVDRDGWPDMLIANDTVQNHFFHNLHDGTFEEYGAMSGFGFDRSGAATGAMGIDAGYPLNDATLAIGVGNFANEMTSFYMATESPLVFADQSLMEGIGAPSRARLTFGLLLLDVDLDGRLDLVQTNGHLEEEINRIQPSQTYAQPAQLFWNQGVDAECCFAVVEEAKTGDLAQPIVGRGAAYADIDADGDLDLVLTQAGGPPVLLRNDCAGDHHWLRLHLTGTKSNRDAMGARVEAVVDGHSMFRTVSPTRSYLSQVEKTVTFGLGAATQVDRLIIIWPSGDQVELTDVDGDQVLFFTESE